ncbi:MAG: hypothetical protein ACT4NY_06285, partial [Pseudonocardiales bacterium]
MTASAPCVEASAAGNDSWMFDRETVAFTHFSGGGHVLDRLFALGRDVVTGWAQYVTDDLWWSVGGGVHRSGMQGVCPPSS